MDTLKQHTQRFAISTTTGRSHANVETLREEMLMAIGNLREQQSLSSAENNHRFDLIDLRLDASLPRAELTSAIAMQEKTTSAALSAVERTLAKSEAASEQRFDSVSEFLARLSDQALTFLPRSEFAAAAVAQEHAVAAAADTAAVAVSKADAATEKRFDAINEFRAQLADQAITYLPRTEFAAAIASLERAASAAMAAQEKAVEAALTSAERAVGKSEIASEKRFDAVNEFRGQLADQASTFLPRAEFDRVTSAITEKIDSSNKSFAERVDDLRSSRDATQGKSAGLNAGWAALIALVGLIGTVLMIAMAFRR